MEIDRERIKIYFEHLDAPKKPTFPYISLIVILFATLFLAYTGINILAFFLLIILGYIFYSYQSSVTKYNNIKMLYESEPSDSEIDEWLRTDIERISNESYEKLNIEKNHLIDSPEIIVGLPSFWDTSYSHKVRVGKDNVLRYSNLTINCIFFTDKQILMFTCLLNFMTGDLEKENSKEYFYNDIVSVELTKGKSDDYLFEIYTSAGTKYSLPISSEKLIQEQANTVITKTRLILRDKKK